MAQVEAIETAIRDELDGTQFAAASLTPLRGGTANFIYRAVLQSPLNDGTSEVLVKHGEGYVAQNPGFALTTSRCEIEVESLKLLSGLPHAASPAYDLGTPGFYYFDAGTNTQIQEYLPGAVSLKDYALKHLSSPGRGAEWPRLTQLGVCLGRWLRSFHDWSDGPDGRDLRAVLARNTEMQTLKKTINYDQLLALRATAFPSILGDDEDVLRDIVDMATAELRDGAGLRPIHGDFWTGNILLPDGPLQEHTPTPVRIVDWEMAQVGVRAEDVGQLMAELWQLKLYRGIDAGVYIMRGFVDGYGSVDADFAFRALLHVGAHLVCFGATTPAWGTAEQNEEVARAGRHVLLGAWKKDLTVFGGHDLECLLRRRTSSS